MSKKKCIELVSVLAHRHYGSYCILRDIKDFCSYFRFWRNSSSLKDLKYREFWHRKSCVFFLWWMKLHVCLYQETEWHLESKNSLVRSVYDVTEYKVCSFAVNSNTQPSQLCCYLRTAASPAFIYYYDLGKGIDKIKKCWANKVRHGSNFLPSFQIKRKALIK